MINIIQIVLVIALVCIGLFISFYVVVFIVHIYSCLRTDFVEIVKFISTDLSERAHKRRRVHCIIIEYTPQARVVDSTDIVPFTIAVPDAVEIDEN